MTNFIKINIASPAYGSTYSSEYVKSLFDLTKNGLNIGLDFCLTEIDWADIVMSRNYLISNFYFKELDCTHILFLDTDMGFEKELIYEMIEKKLDLVGVAAPKRNFNLKKFYEFSKKYNFEKAYAKSCEFIWQKKLRIKTGEPKIHSFEEVDRCGAGIMLISRECVKTMINKVPDIVKEGPWAKIWLGREFNNYITPFDKLKLNGVEYSEDFSFCHRWTKICGGKIYVNTNRNIKHVGRLIVESNVSNIY